MPIEFRCTQCDKLLRTGDETAGKQAKCPECGTVMTIPLPDSAGAPPSQPMGSFEAAPSPFAGPSAPAPQDTGNPYQSPTGMGAEQQFFAAPGEIRPTQIGFGETFSRTWAVFTERWLPVSGAVFVLFIINMVASLIMQGFTAAITGAVDNEAVVILFLFFIQVAFNVLALWLMIGLQMFTLAAARGEESNFGLLFAGGRYLLSIILLSILMTLVLLLGLALLVIPFFIFLVMFWQAQLLVIDRNLGVMEAMSTSRDVMVGNKLTLFLILFVVFLVLLIAGIPIVLLTCGLGYFVILAYYFILNVVVYLGVTGQPTMADRYAMPQEQPGGTPFGPTPGAPAGDSPFSS